MLLLFFFNLFVCFFPLVLFCVFLFSFLSLYLFLIIIVVTNVVVVSLSFFVHKRRFLFCEKKTKEIYKKYNTSSIFCSHIFSYGEKSIQSVIVVGGRRKIGKSHTNSNAAAISTRFSLLIEATTDWFSVVGGSCLYYCCCRSFYFFVSTLLFFAFILFKLCFHYYFIFTIVFFFSPIVFDTSLLPVRPLADKKKLVSAFYE